MKFTITLDSKEDNFGTKLFALVNAEQMKSSIGEFSEALRRKLKYNEYSAIETLRLEEVNELLMEHLGLYLE